MRVWAISATDHSQQLLAVLQGHRGMAKGVAWDPIDRYIASQGDDRAVVVWSTRDWDQAAPIHQKPSPTLSLCSWCTLWVQAARIEEPFQRSTHKTLFRRLSWSPDGQFLCCPHAFKRPANIAVVLRRPAADAGWVQECDFVGHNSPVVVSAFNPFLFKPAEKNAEINAEMNATKIAEENASANGAKPAAGYHSCCALAGQVNGRSPGHICPLPQRQCAPFPPAPHKEKT